MKYQITVSKNQMRIIQNALESYFRLRMGQFFDYATEIAEYGYVYDNNNPENDRLFSDYINRRNDAEELFNKAYAVAVPDPYNRRKTEDVQNAIDIWHVIRHQFWKDRPNHSDWTTDSIEPFAIAGEPLCKIERIEGDMGNGK